PQPWCAASTARSPPPTARSWRPRRCSAGSGSWTCPISTPHSLWPPVPPSPVACRSRCVRSRTNLEVTDAASDHLVAKAFRDEYGPCVSTLTRFLGDISLAEEAVAEAFVVALEHWDPAAPPPNPGGWIMTPARRRAIDRLRREATREARHTEAM